MAVNTELLDANWQTGRYIIEFEQGGNAKAKYGDRLLVNLSKDLTRLKGRGFSRSVLRYPLRAVPFLNPIPAQELP